MSLESGYFVFSSISINTAFFFSLNLFESSLFPSLFSSFNITIITFTEFYNGVGTCFVIFVSDIFLPLFSKKLLILSSSLISKTVKFSFKTLSKNLISSLFKNDLFKSGRFPSRIFKIISIQH